MPSWLERLRDALAPLGIVPEREIGEGGMGRVCLGRDIHLDRPIAIKVLKPEMASAVSAERFLREARDAAGIRHPNVVQVHRQGQVDGFFYYTMDYIAGPTLADVLRKGCLPGPEVVRVGRDVLAALAAVHARGLVHRDVKPSNIFVTPERALLGDFGIAYEVESDRTQLTGPEDVVGTLGYISPEQMHRLPITPRTDIYLMGLVLYEAASGRRWMPLSSPDRGEWTRVPEPLREPIRRALRLDAAERWASADDLSLALARAGEVLERERARGGSVRRAWLGTLAVAGVAGLAAAAWWMANRPRHAGPDLVIVPFATAGAADSSMGSRLSTLTGYSFERLTDRRLAKRQLGIRLWHASTLPPARRLEEVVRATQSRHGAWAVLRPRGARLEVQVTVVAEDGLPVLESTLAGDTMDLSPLGDSIALTIARRLSIEPHGGGGDPFADLPLAAKTEFLLGEDAFARDAWLTAERHYQRALEADSTFVLAAWRLGTARRWMPLRTSPPYPPGFRRLFDSHRETLPRVDRLLIEAQFLPSGAERFARYDEAVTAAPDDPSAALLYGDELFHRGPLAGRALEDAVAMLRRAVTIDSTLAPGWEHLAWALIRLGRRDSAGRALASLERWAGRPDESEIYLPMFLRIAHELRFRTSPQAGAADGLLRDPAALALAARGAMSFDLPAEQAALAGALAQSGATPDVRASGLTGLGVALFALGRPAAALAAFDSAATRFSRPAEARLQAAEWRVIPAALGVPGVDEAERERGRAALTGMLADSALAPRAAWALALDGWARGDTAAAHWWSGRAAAPFVPVLEGMRRAAAGRWQDALTVSAPALAFDSAGHAPDLFLRAALHTLRGEWLLRLGRHEEADRSWLWYENLDVRGWPDAEAQPAEVDWALGTHTRARRAGLALEAGRSEAGCALARRALELWANTEPALRTPAADLASRARGCPR